MCSRARGRTRMEETREPKNPKKKSRRHSGKLKLKVDSEVYEKMKLIVTLGMINKYGYRLYF